MKSLDEWKEKVYVCSSVDGGVSVIIPSLAYCGSEEEWLKLNELTSEINYISLHPMQLPGDRYFRDAWRLVDDAIIIDMPRAIEIHIEHLCELRDKKLKELDLESLKILESGRVDGLDRILTQKQLLREMPEDSIFEVEDLTKLRNLIPDYLR